MRLCWNEMATMHVDAGLRKKIKGSINFVQSCMSLFCDRKELLKIVAKMVTK